jgi:hypothetical protein
MEEAARGYSGAASRRLEALASILILPLNEEVVKLCKALIQQGGLPAKALDEALHSAVSAVHGMDYLLNWNCRRIDNAEKKPSIVVVADGPVPGGAVMLVEAVKFKLVHRPSPPYRQSSPNTSCAMRWMASRSAGSGWRSISLCHTPIPSPRNTASARR